jgi:hypothetical protein
MSYLREACKCHNFQPFRVMIKFVDAMLTKCSKNCYTLSERERERERGGGVETAKIYIYIRISQNISSGHELVGL